jgi:ferritin-like metal-binding protein YciE
VAEVNERDTKLIQWLGEAHAKEAELEADLTAHISLTEKAAYKKRLQQHLKETRDHKRRVASRIKQLGGGTPPTGPSVPGVPDAVGEVAGKAVAAVKGQVGAARALVTEQSETHLRNAQEELREEHVEIAMYTRIEAFAQEVGDKETAQLAKGIRRDEERMAKYLDAELRRLVKDVVRAQIPRDQRSNGSRPSSRRKSSSARASSNGAASSRKTASKSGSGRSSTAKRTTAKSSAAKRTTAKRTTAKRTTAKRATASRSRTTARAGTARRSASTSSRSRARSGSSSR